MLIPFIGSMCIVGVVIVGLLVMTQAVSLEGLWRGFVIVVLAAIALWLLVAALLPILICALVWLKQAALTVFLIVLAATVGTTLLRAVVLRAWKETSSTDRRRRVR